MSRWRIYRAFRNMGFSGIGKQIYVINNYLYMLGLGKGSDHQCGGLLVEYPIFLNAQWILHLAYHVTTQLFTLTLSNAQVMFNKFDPFNLNNGVVTWNV